MGWEKRQVLGKGRYGTVFLGEPTSPTVPPIAIKSCPLDDAWSLELEKKVLTRLRGCVQVVSCYGDMITTESSDVFYDLLLEYAAGGTLKGLIRRGPGMSEHNTRCCVRMILRGLRIVHLQGLVHCDLKPSNILVFPDEERSNHYRLKIADFGLVKQRGDDEEDLEEGEYLFRGTPMYMSPESVAYGEIEPALDIWSLGCIVIEMITGKRAWRNFGSLENLMVKLTKDQESPAIPEALSDEGKDFVSKCLARDPTERWTAEMLLDHPFVATLDIASLPIGENIESPASPKSLRDITPSCSGTPRDQNSDQSQFSSDGLPPSSPSELGPSAGRSPSCIKPGQN